MQIFSLTSEFTFRNSDFFLRISIYISEIYTSCNLDFCLGIQSLHLTIFTFSWNAEFYSCNFDISDQNGIFIPHTCPLTSHDSDVFLYK